MSPRTHHYKKHFAEIFSDTLGFDLTSYARSGFSNGGIAAQIESAIQQKPNLILLNLTNSDRIEFSTGNLNKNQKQPITIDDISDCVPNSGETSDPFYNYDSSKSIISQNLISFLHDSQVGWGHEFYNKMYQKYTNWDKKVEAIKLYFEFLYDELWKNTADQMMMHTVLYRLEKSNIPYILVHDWLGLTTNFAYKPDWFTQKHTVHGLVHLIRQTKGPLPNKDPGFHLTYEGSEEVAKVLIEHYNRYFNLHIEHSK